MYNPQNIYNNTQDTRNNTQDMYSNTQSYTEKQIISTSTGYIEPID